MIDVPSFALDPGDRDPDPQRRTPNLNAWGRPLALARPTPHPFDLLDELAHVAGVQDLACRSSVPASVQPHGDHRSEQGGSGARVPRLPGEDGEPLGPHNQQHKQRRGPLRPGKAPIVRALRVSTRILEVEAPRAVGSGVPGQGDARRLVPQDGDASPQDHAEQPQRFHGLDGVEPHADIGGREPKRHVSLTIANAPGMWATVTAAHHQASDTPTRDKESYTQHDHVQVRQKGIAPQPQQHSGHDQHPCLVMVVDDALLAADHLGDHGQSQQHRDRSQPDGDHHPR